MTAETTERDLVEEAEELLAKATPGPWQARFIYRIFESARRDPINLFGTKAEQDWPDSELIAAAPELLRRLVEEVKALRRGEFICQRCHLRKDAEFEKGVF